MWYWDRWRLTVILFILLSYLFTVFILRVFKWFLDFQMLHAACLIWHSCSFFNCINCLNCRMPADWGGVSTVIYLTLLSLSPSLYSQLLSLSFHISTRIPPPSQLPWSLIVALTERPLRSTSECWEGCVSCISDFAVSFLQYNARASVRHAFISKSEAYETENLPHFSPCMSLKIRHLRFCLQTQHVN